MRIIKLIKERLGEPAEAQALRLTVKEWVTLPSPDLHSQERAWYNNVR